MLSARCTDEMRLSAKKIVKDKMSAQLWRVHDDGDN